MDRTPRPAHVTTFSWRHYGKDHPRVVDVALSAVLFLAVSGPAVLNADLSDTDNLTWESAVPPAATALLALLWRRSYPRTVVVVTALCAAVAGGFGYLITPLLLAPVMIALYELAGQVPPRTAWGFYLGTTALVVVSEVLGGQGGYPWFLAVLNPILFLLLPIVLAGFTRLRQDYVAAVTARAEYAEKNREEEARHRVAEERVRIARELHDVVAHHLALANAQAGTAAYLARNRSDQVEPILAELAVTTSSALRELKATVGLLRHPDDHGSPLEPAPGLGQLPELTAAFASAGLDVEVVTDGVRQELSPGADLTAYRIVQEALTNVVRHATTKTAAVRLAYGRDRLTVTVENDAGPPDPAPASRGPGFGILGMRERAESAGGRLHAGPRPEGGFTVRTELPIRP
ncbi:sensor histidine kinase [Amycolatopsis solani]|uniref:sensor histidine kinase n=1 Tax=Amycolatopsis solani TaxID=3028615 RepID=UPI0025AFC427|nr:sensor histidine kinase [Amycolatopsis sp. MEP2-6]